jgi:hypothetical protein
MPGRSKNVMAIRELRIHMRDNPHDRAVQRDTGMDRRTSRPCSCAPWYQALEMRIKQSAIIAWHSKLLKHTNERHTMKLLLVGQPDTVNSQPGYVLCKGCVSRELLKADDGTWFDIVHFETMADAQSAMQNFLGHPSTKAFEEAIDPSTAQMRHFEVARKY